MSENKSINESLELFFKRYDTLIKILWDKRKNILITNGITTVLAILLVLILFTPYYDSEVVILPDYGNKMGISAGIGGLASLAGLSGLGKAPLPLIYENISYSESVLKNVIYKKYKTEKFADSVNLLDYYEIEANVGKTDELITRERLVLMVKYFNKNIVTIDMDRLTEILTIRVRTPESRLSKEVVNNLVSELDTYIRNQKRSYATEQRFYIEKRIVQVKDSLWRAEEELKMFRESNRNFNQSNQLMLEQARLSRNVEVQQTIFLTLTQQLELVKIEEIKDIPVLNVLEPAGESVIKKGPRRVLIILVFVFFAGILSLAYFYFEESIKEILKYIRNKFLQISAT